MGTTEPEQDAGAVACSTKQTQLGEGVRWDARCGVSEFVIERPYFSTPR